MVLDSAQNTANEKQLFHGTSSDSVDAICKQNFDWRMCGKNGNKYGEGSYFASKASYSDCYARKDADGFQFMFLARVLVGLFTKGRSSYRRPPPKDPSTPASDLYDSCVNSKNDPTIFVVFDMDQYYPEYVFKYFTMESASCPTPQVQSANPTPTSLPSSNAVKPFPILKAQRPTSVSGNAQLSLANKGQSSGRLTYNTAKPSSISNIQQPTTTTLIPQVQSATLRPTSRPSSNTVKPSPILIVQRPTSGSGNTQLSLANKGQFSGRLPYKTAESPSISNIQQTTTASLMPQVSVANQGLSSGRSSPNFGQRSLNSVNVQWPPTPIENSDGKRQAPSPGGSSASQSSTKTSGSNVRRTTKPKQSKCCRCLIL